MNDLGLHRGGARYAFIALFSLGLALRLLVVALPGARVATPWSGGGDTGAYLLLADNLLKGSGFSYAGQPSAFRPPGYPLILAGMKMLFGTRYLPAVRWLQLALGLATVYLCARASVLLFGESAWRPTLALTLLFPTLVFATGEVLTECIAAFFYAGFLYLTVKELSHPRLATVAGLGLSAGLAVLFRMNMAVLVLTGLWAVLRAKNAAPRWQRPALMLLLVVLVVAPWVARNWIVFRGQVFFSTLSGPSAALGILTPQGRTQPGETERIRLVLGWCPPQDLETNDARRTMLPSEPELNRRAWIAAWKLSRDKGWRLLPLELLKVAYFWLSADQVLSNQSFLLPLRLLRLGGVVAYWLLLALAVSGWSSLRKTYAHIADTLLVYAILLTVSHLPFVMNTRYRVPLADPLLAALAGGGLLSVHLGRVEAVAAATPAAPGRSMGG